jgi:hypothetical protein
VPISFEKYINLDDAILGKESAFIPFLIDF